MGDFDGESVGAAVVGAWVGDTDGGPVVGDWDGAHVDWPSHNLPRNRAAV